MRWKSRTFESGVEENPKNVKRRGGVLPKENAFSVKEPRIQPVKMCPKKQISPIS